MSDSKQTPEHIEAVKSIQKKLLGKQLTYHEIFNLMDEIAHDRLGKVLTTYFVASSFVEGFSPEELYHLTKAMVETGRKLHFDGIVADKHSTGGVAGTRATMIVTPIVAAAGFKIPKSSSRAITSPAGTADVMEVLAPVTFSPEEIERIVNKIGGCIVWGGKLGIAPADDIIIDVEEELSFESFDKVIVSIMAKKVAVGANHLILDLPYGQTMKIRHEKDAETVARKFKALGHHFGMEVIAYVNNPRQPAGLGIGPRLEARDVLWVLEQDAKRPMDLEAKSLKLAGDLLDICYKSDGQHKNGRDEAERILKSGEALKKFKEIVEAQGGDPKITSHQLGPIGHSHIVRAAHTGSIGHINNINLNTIAKILGAPGDPDAGLMLHVRLGDTISEGDPMFTFYSTNKHRLEEAQETLVNLPIYEIKH